MAVFAEKVTEPELKTNPNLKFHRRMAYTCTAIVAIDYAGCKITSIHTHVGGSVIALILVLAMIFPLPVYWHEKHRIDFRESALVLPWEALLAIILTYTVLIAARARMPLQDPVYGRFDQSLGISVPAIVAWSHRHLIGRVITWTYPLLIPLLGVSAFAPQLLGKVKYAREFLIGNLAAFAIGVPLFALVPAIGPWHYFHTVPAPPQALCEAQLLALRLPGPFFSYLKEAGGLVCFPSFHVIWAILCADALWGFRPLRIPVMLLAALIIASTLTTGWHYFADVMAGLIIVGLSLAFAKFCTRNLDPGFMSKGNG